MFCRFSLRKGIESSILAGQQNCRSCKISASGMLSARWPVSGAQPPVRSGHRASVKEATARPCSEAGMKTSCLLFTKASQSPTSIPLGIDSPKSPPTRLPPCVAGPTGPPGVRPDICGSRASRSPKSDSQLLFSALRASKSAPRDFQETSRLPRELQELSKRPQNRF